MRDAIGVPIRVGNRVQILRTRMQEQPSGVVTHFYSDFVSMRSDDGAEWGMLPENVMVLDSDLEMDEGL